MSDETEDLRKLLGRAPPPKPRAAARARALDAAMAAFDAEAATEESAEKISAPAQGSDETLRRRGRQSGLRTLLRRLAMTFTLPSTRTLMLGGASLAVLTLAVVSVQQQPRDLLRGLNGRPNLEQGRTTTAAPAPQVGRASELNESASVIGGRADRDDAGLANRNVDKLSGSVAAPTEPSTLAPRSRTEAEAPVAAPAAPGREIAPLASSERRAAPQQRSEAFRAQGQVDSPATGIRAKTRDEADLRIAPPPSTTGQYEEQGRDRFADVDSNQVKVTAEEPVSTFSIDVDTASYTFVRSSLMQGVLPPKDAVRVEEMINYFPYDYTRPTSRETPFSTDIAVWATPWNAQTRLMRIGIQGYELAADEKPRSNLVFLIDTSGSMNHPDKLPLLLESFRLMINNLDDEDTVSIVVYAGSAGTVLEPTKVKDRDRILAALDQLQSGGSTAGGEGIRQAYQLAERNFDKGAINRVILATDGDFNVGITDVEELKDFVERKRETGVFLSVLGFGRGNYNDDLMQALAQNGNGNAAYIDTLAEARKILVEEASSTLFPIAKDVKIQVEFNPSTVAEYRLIGYETRLLAREDFNNDRVDAGEIGAGHSVTALYEITPVGSPARLFDELRFQTTATQSETDWAGELAFVRLRYKQPDATASQLVELPVVTTDDQAEPDTEARFAAAVAAFGQLLRGGRYTGTFTYDDVVALAKDALGSDPYGYRAEFVNLARRASIAAAMEPQRQ